MNRTRETSCVEERQDNDGHPVYYGSWLVPALKSYSLINEITDISMINSKHLVVFEADNNRIADISALAGNSFGQEIRELCVYGYHVD